MTPRRQRMVLAGLVVVGVGLAVTFALRAFNDNLLFFYTPSEVLAGQAPTGKKFRLGGLVEEGSITREPGELEVRFIVTDNAEKMTVAYSGVLPDLFRDGQGVIALGHLEAGGIFRAEEVLAKHDENYMPKEVQEKLVKNGHPAGRNSISTVMN